MSILGSILKLSLGLGLSGTAPLSNQLSRHVDTLSGSLETRGWEGSISSPLPIIPEAELWLRAGPLRAAVSYAANIAGGTVTHDLYGTADYSFYASEFAARIELLGNLGPIHLYCGPSGALSKLAVKSSSVSSEIDSSYSSFNIGAEAGVGVTLPFGKWRLGAELYGRYQPGTLQGLWFNPDEGILYESPGPAPDDIQGTFSTTGVGIRILAGLAL